jgi:hypothetical protein
MSNMYRGHAIDASYQALLHLAEGFQRRRLKCEKLTDDGHQVMAKTHIAFGKVSQKGCSRLAAASNKVYQLLARGRWFSPASFATKTGRHGIADILLKVELNTKNQIKSNLDNYTGVTGEKSQKVLAKLDINFTLITNTYAGSP